MSSEINRTYATQDAVPRGVQLCTPWRRPSTILRDMERSINPVDCARGPRPQRVHRLFSVPSGQFHGSPRFHWWAVTYQDASLTCQSHRPYTTTKTGPVSDRYWSEEVGAGEALLGFLLIQSVVDNSLQAWGTLHISLLLWVHETKHGTRYHLLTPDEWHVYGCV